MIWSWDLIEQAEHLASKERGRPKEASLRRAVSTAYYALFHELCRITANALVGSSTRWETYSPVYRLIDHKVAKSLFERTRNAGSGEFRALGAAVAEIGENFIRLQDERHRADYDPRPYPHDRYVVLGLVASAKESSTKLDALSRDVKLELAVRLMAASKRK